MIDVSIIIPAKNEEDIISSILKSTNKQLEDKDEIIVIDDSEDETPDIATRHGCRVVKQGKDREGVAGAKTQGVELACNEIVMFFEADMESISNGFISEVKKAFDNGARAVSWNSEMSKNVTVLERTYNSFLETNLILLRKDQPDLIMSVRKELFYKVGGFLYARYGEDKDLDWKIREEIEKEKIEDIDATSRYRKTKNPKEIFKQARWLGETASTPIRTVLYLCLLCSMFSFLLSPLSLLFLIPTILYLFRIPIALTKRKEGLLLPLVDFLYASGYLSGVL